MAYYRNSVNVSNFIQSGSITSDGYTSFPTGANKGTLAFQDMQYGNSIHNQFVPFLLGYQINGNDIATSLFPKNIEYFSGINQTINVTNYRSIAFVLVGGGGGGYNGDQDVFDSVHGNGGGAGGIIVGTANVVGLNTITYSVGTGGLGVDPDNQQTYFPNGGDTNLTINSNNVLTAKGGKGDGNGGSFTILNDNRIQSTFGKDGGNGGNGSGMGFSARGGHGGDIDDATVTSGKTDNVISTKGSGGTSLSQRGKDATGYGAGGGGGLGTSGKPPGGNGAPGYLRIYFYGG
jgi:hypothetical protein